MSWPIPVVVMFALILAMACDEGSDGGENRDPVVTVTAESTSIPVGTPTDLTATTSGGEDSTYTWETDNTEIGFIDAFGKFTGVVAGDVTVTATGNDTGASGSLLITVVE